MQKNPVVFWELASHDMEKSVRFFRDVFEWQIDFDDHLGFYIIPATTPTDRSLEGGIFTLKQAKLPFVALYLRVEDIEQKALLVAQKGGLVIETPHEIPGGSKICLFNEPSGVTFAMIQPKSSN
jgi:predicted enzyme related to lactoylglutathione lyase